MPRLCATERGGAIPRLRATRECVPSAPTTIRAVSVVSLSPCCSRRSTCEFSRSTCTTRESPAPRPRPAPDPPAPGPTRRGRSRRRWSCRRRAPPSPDCVCTNAPVTRWIAAASPISASRSVRSEISPEQCDGTPTRRCSSISRTRSPARARFRAVRDPAGPAPITATSQSVRIQRPLSATPEVPATEPHGPFRQMATITDGLPYCSPEALEG